MERFKKIFLTRETYLIISLILIIVGMMGYYLTKGVERNLTIAKITSVEYESREYLEVSSLKPYITNESYNRLSSGNKYEIIYNNKHHLIEPIEIVNSQFVKPNEVESIFKNQFKIMIEKKSIGTSLSDIESISIFNENDYQRCTSLKDTFNNYVITGVFLLFGTIMLCYKE